MKTITLTQGQHALVDDADFESLSKFKWLAKKCRHKIGINFYAIRWIYCDGKRLTVWMHRQIIGVEEKFRTDHINGDGLDNQRSNLRPATATENSRNQRKRVGTSSRYKGVSWNREKRKWHCRIGVTKQIVQLGYFEKEEAAALAYDQSAVRHFGEFALTNFPATP